MKSLMCGRVFIYVHVMFVCECVTQLAVLQTHKCTPFRVCECDTADSLWTPRTDTPMPARPPQCTQLAVVADSAEMQTFLSQTDEKLLETGELGAKGADLSGKDGDD